jgi:4-hydroxyphenylpyruvate dioxygenase-like putative hemolysin
MEEHELLRETQFKVVNHNDERMSVIDPWGSKFEIISSEKVKDPRGVQDNIDDAESLGNGIDNVTIYAPSGANMVGIARFYEKVMDTPALIVEENQCIVSMGPHQTLTFQSIQKDDGDINMHVDLRDEQDKNPEGQQYYPSNYGPHISLYVRDIRSTYKRADELGVTYVNPRFSRRAYCEEEVVKDCMFRCLDIVDPDNVNEGVILRLEHEVRSVLKFDGSLYNSCPFVKVPDGCVI